jgi:hypothetical protein
MLNCQVGYLDLDIHSDLEDAVEIVAINNGLRGPSAQNSEIILNIEITDGRIIIHSRNCDRVGARWQKDRVEAGQGVGFLDRGSQGAIPAAGGA